MIIRQDDIAKMEKRYRGKFINSVLGAKPALLVGSQDQTGNTNLAIMSSVFHLGASPALIGLIIRPSESARHTLNNILTTDHYTLNHVTRFDIAAAHQTSARYPAEQSEFAASGLSQKYLCDFPAPFVAESTIRLGLKLVEHQLLSINNTHLIIGEINLIELTEDILAEDGFVDIASNGTIAATGLDSYAVIDEVMRFSYAKTDSWPQEINVEK